MDAKTDTVPAVTNDLLILDKTENELLNGGQIANVHAKNTILHLIR